MVHSVRAERTCENSGRLYHRARRSRRQCVRAGDSRCLPAVLSAASRGAEARDSAGARRQDRKSTRLNSSHPSISYAVFCLKKKNNPHKTPLFKKKKKQTI